MYNSPVELIVSDLQRSIMECREQQIIRAIESIDVKVDKDELIKALKYDRQQYTKGYNDGVEEFAKNLMDHLKQQPHWCIHRQDIVTHHESVGLSYDDVFFGIEKVLRELRGG